MSAPEIQLERGDRVRVQGIGLAVIIGLDLLRACVLIEHGTTREWVRMRRIVPRPAGAK